MRVVLTGQRLLDLRAEGGFYPQTWYLGHQFAAMPWIGEWDVPEGWSPGEMPGKYPAIVLARAWQHKSGLWRDRYVWTADYDDFGCPVYVGMTAGDGKSEPGFQVHRLLIPDGRWGVPA